MTDQYMAALDAFEERIESLTGKPQSSTPAELRAKLIVEEAVEADEAIRKHPLPNGEPSDLPHLAKELADLLYVVFGTAQRFNIPIWDVFQLVHESNMSKLADGCEIREDGKIRKSPAYRDPTEGIKELLDA